MAIIFPVWVCLFLQGVFQALLYFLFLDYQPCLVWTFTWGIRSVLGGPFLSQCLRRFWRGFQSGQKTFPIFPAWSGLIFFLCLVHQSYWQSLLLSPGCSFTQFFSGGFLRYLSCIKMFPVFSRLQNSRRDCYTPVSNVLENIVPALFFPCSVTNKGILGFLTCFTTALL